MELIDLTFLADLFGQPFPPSSIEIYNDPVVAAVSISFLKFNA